MPPSLMWSKWPTFDASNIGGHVAEAEGDFDNDQNCDAGWSFTNAGTKSCCRCKIAGDAASA